MKKQASAPLILCLASCLGATTATAEVKSLSSSELTETYIKDSTVIITPKQSSQTTTTSVSSITIAPVENTDQDIQELGNSQLHREGTITSFELDDETLRNASVDSALNPLTLPTIAAYEDPQIYTPVADIFDNEQYRAPEGDFDIDYVGNDLGLSRSGQQLTFSIGNLPGIDNIQLPYGVDEGPLQITPREGGGFDLTINVPQDNID
jgi:hypothetical protein